MRNKFVYLVLRILALVSRLLWRHEYVWVGGLPERPWPPYRLAAILNHTSLYEGAFAGITPPSFLKRMAEHCTVPIADVTIKRPIVGLFWRSVAANVVSISRERDQTWQEVIESVDDPESMVIILPEGRMKRETGLDKHGRPMRIRSGIADLLHCYPDGKMLICYSQGLHHIQVPGQLFPNLFQPIRARFEELDIAEYREEMAEGLEDPKGREFANRVILDLTERRDRHCTSDRGGTDVPEEWEDRDDVIRPRDLERAGVR